METVDSTLRLPSDLDKKIKAEAERTRRNKHSQIIWILEEYFRSADDERPDFRAFNRHEKERIAA
jgi:hypothetical protein